MRTAKSSCKNIRAVLCLKGTAIGSSTVLRRLSKEFGQVSQVGTKTTLTPVMNKKKLDFARRHRHWTLAEWKKVLMNAPCSSLYLATCTLRCHYTKSNPIDDHSNISSKKLQKQNFKRFGPLYLHAVWYLPFTNSPRKHTVTYHFSVLQEVYNDNRQIHTKCQLKYLHQPHISTSGKCHCVIIHQTTKATEYIG